MIIEHFIGKLKIIEAKGLKNLDIDFKNKGLTAILGPNGCGKSTILHLLACGYNPISYSNERSQDYRFPQFFLPVSFVGEDSFSWEGTKFIYTNNINKQERKLSVNKSVSRWMRYNKRPNRWVSYIGISTCVPDIENEKRRSLIDYSVIGNSNSNILENARYILGKGYVEYCLCKRKDNRINSRVSAGGIQYTSLSMGAGEQRIFKILQEVDKIPPYGLILIDEIDLLLHQASLKRLLEVLVKEADNKNLQIIFTAHNQFILTLPNIEFRHIYQGDDMTYCLPGNDPRAIEQLTGNVHKDIDIYVEDELGKALIQQICSEVKCLKRVSIFTFGAITNAFPLLVASGSIPIMKQRKILFVLDGDLYRDDNKRLTQLEKHLTGQSEDIKQQRNNLLIKIKQFVLPENRQPEEYYYSLIKEVSEKETTSEKATLLLEEIKKQNNIVTTDKHQLLSDPIYNLGMTKPEGYGYIAEFLSKCDRWKEMTNEVRSWILEQIGNTTKVEHISQ
jgi:hypothetical protein